MITKLELFLTCEPDANELKTAKGYNRKERQSINRTLALDPQQAEAIFQRIEDYAVEQLVAAGAYVQHITTKTGYRG